MDKQAGLVGAAVLAMPPRARGMGQRTAVALRAFGPGLIAGASDCDPTTVAALAVIGASTGYRLSWLVLLLIPMLVVVQVTSAAVGTTAQAGLQRVIRRRFGAAWAILALVCVVSVNEVTLAADLEGGGAALSLLTGWPYAWFLVPLALGALILLTGGGSQLVQRVLLAVLLLFLAYVAAAFLARPDWAAVFHDTLVPRLDPRPELVGGALALLGTTLTSYVYVWETIEVAHQPPPRPRRRSLQLDAAIGMVGAGLIFWFILIATGATLGVAHHPVQTAQDAAMALAPLAGPLAPFVFGLGLLGSALLVVPILVATNAHVLADTFGWEATLDTPVGRARRFYLVVVLSLAVAVGVAFLGISPFALLIFSSIVGGLATPLTLGLLLLAARDRAVMAGQTISGRLAAAGWCVLAIIAAAGTVYVGQTLLAGA